MSGERRVVSSTGGAKGAKPEAYDLLPYDSLDEVARVFSAGAEKYSPHNWRKGYPWSLSFAAAQRHLSAFWQGEEADPESGLPHLAHATFHMLALLHYARVKKYKRFDDRSQ